MNTILRSLALSGLVAGAGLCPALGDSVTGLQEAHISGVEAGAGGPAVDPADVDFINDAAALKSIGEVTAPIAEASTADDPSEHSVDGQPGDTGYPFGLFKPLATVGEYDPDTGYPLTGYPDGHAAWLADEDTVRVAYQSESYGFGSNETYPWVMANGATFSGSHVHTIDYNRAMFADFLQNDSAASEMFEASGHLFDTVYNAFGNLVQPKTVAAAGEYWGKQSLPDGSLVNFSTPLVGADYFFHSFCGAHYEKANRYGEGIGFADDAYLCAEEWDIGDGAYESVRSIDTMGLASMVVDIANGVAYTVPALGQSGYEKLLPVNPGSPDYVVIVCAGYNFDQPVDTAPLRIYVGKKGVDENNEPVDQEGDASERDKFLARNGLLYGKVYGMALANDDYAVLNLALPDLDALLAGNKAGQQMFEKYLQDGDAPANFSVRYYPTSYQWAGWGTANAVSVAETEATKWFEPAEQPAGHTFFPADDKVEHPAVDPDITKFRFVQNMTNKGALIGVEFTDLIAELEADGGLPAFLSADVSRIIAAIDGELTLEVGNKGLSHDGVNTHAGHVERGNVHKMEACDGLQWIKSADADILIVDEDSGNNFGERKYAIPLNPETFELAEPNTGYFLAMAGGSANPRAANGVSAYGGTFWRPDSSEFSGSWNVTALVAEKPEGGFYTPAELLGTGEQLINMTKPLAEQLLIGVVQHRGESAGPVSKFRADWGGQLFMFNVCLPTPGLQAAHIAGFEDGSNAPAVDPAEADFASDVVAVKTIGQVTAPIAEASTADEASEHSVDGQPGDQDYPFLSNLKPLATVGEVDLKTGYPVTGYPDGHAAWLADEDTVRVAYQSESYAFGSNETYPWVMANGATFSGSHVHTIDYNRAMFADFLQNDSAASEMFEASGHLFDTVYNAFGNLVQPKTVAAAGEYWGKQSLPDGSLVNFSTPLVGADYYFHSFCGAHYEKANRYGDGIGFADDAYLCAEEWDIGDGAYESVRSIDTMGLASVVVDIANGVAYTVPALGQSGYEKLLPVNPGSPDYVVIVCAGYNFDQPNDTAPLRIYVGKKGVDENNEPVDQEGGASERDKFLARNGLLYGKVYGMALANGDYAGLNLPMPDLAALRAGNKVQLLDQYVGDPAAPENFTVRYYPTSYQWAGWGPANAVSVAGTEATKWFEDAEQPDGFTFFPADDKVEHPAVDPDITKLRFVQNLTNKGALIGVEFSDLIAELEASGDLPEFVSADVTRIIAAVDGELTLEVGGKGISHDGVNTHAGHVERGNVHKMEACDGLQWIRSSDADVLIVDEDSGNNFGERKYAIVLNPETLELAEPNQGYFLAMAGGSANPRAANGVSAYGGTFWRPDSSEFSGSWNVTALVARKPDGGFYSPAELLGAGEQQVNETMKLEEQVLIGVVQHRGESAGPVSRFRADWGGQLFMFGIKDINPMGGVVTFDLGKRGSSLGGGALEQAVRAGEFVQAPGVLPEAGWRFAGWDTNFDQVSGDMIVTAQYVNEATANDFDLFSSDQLQALAVGPTVEKDADGNFTISLDARFSTDLERWSDIFVVPSMLDAANGSIQLEFGAIEGNPAFFQFVGD